MKNIIILFACFCCIGNWSKAQSKSNISNIQWEVNPDRESITITYDLQKIEQFRYFDVEITAKLDGEVIPMRHLDGDVGKRIAAGTGKRLVWHFYRDVPQGLKGQLEFAISASSEILKDSDADGIRDIDDHCPFKVGTFANGGCPPLVPAWTGLAAPATLGLGLVTAGFIKQSQASKSYEQDYKCLADPNCEDFDLAAAQDLLKQINKDRKTGIAISVGGAAILAATGIIWVRRLVRNKKRNRSTPITIDPTITTGIDPQRRQINSQVHVGLTYKF